MEEMNIEEPIIEEKKKHKIIEFIVMALLMSGMIYIQLSLYFETEFEIELKYKILIALAAGSAISLILFLLKKFNIIKSTTEEEKLEKKLKKEEEKRRKKEFEESLDKLEIKELLELKEKEEENLSAINEKLDKNERKTINHYVWEFINFGLIIIFVGLLYFGSLDGSYLNRETYEIAINNSIEIGKGSLSLAFDLVLDSFNYLVMKLYDLGSQKPTLMFWIFWISILYWIGYLYIYKILLEGSYKTIKEILIPPIYKMFKQWKQKKN